MPPLQPQEELSTLVEWSSTFAGDRNEVTQSSVYRGNILDHLMKEYDDASGYDFSTISHIPKLSAPGHAATGHVAAGHAAAGHVAAGHAAAYMSSSRKVQTWQCNGRNNSTTVFPPSKLTTTIQSPTEKVTRWLYHENNDCGMPNADASDSGNTGESNTGGSKNQCNPIKLRRTRGMVNLRKAQDMETNNQ